MIIKFLKPFSFLPAIFLMYMIFSFSAQDGATSASLSYQVSYKIVEVGGEVLGADLQPWEVDQLATRFHTPVRKLAHMTEYFLLAISVAFPLYVYGLRGILLLIAAGAICVAFACGDEYHQAFVDGRGPSKRDVLIDSVGVFFGIVLVRIIGWTGRKTIFHPLSRKKKKQDPNYYDPTRYGPYSQPEAESHYDAPYYGGAPYHGEVPYRRENPYRGETPYRKGDPYRGESGETPYSNGPYQDGPYQDKPYPNEPYSNAPYYDGPYYDEDPYPDEDATGTSDRLSEDMSLRKLVNDLKGQKKARRKTDAPR